MLQALLNSKLPNGVSVFEWPNITQYIFMLFEQGISWLNTIYQYQFIGKLVFLHNRTTHMILIPSVAGQTKISSFINRSIIFCSYLNEQERFSDLFVWFLPGGWLLNQLAGIQFVGLSMFTLCLGCFWYNWPLAFHKKNFWKQRNNWHYQKLNCLNFIAETRTNFSFFAAYGRSHRRNMLHVIF